MSNTSLIENLNRALSLELAAVIQYMQHSFLVTGSDREVFRSFFRNQSEEAHRHAEVVGDKVVALGGVPTVEPAMIRQATDLSDMLKQNLELERESLSGYMAAWEACDESNLPTKFLLEGRVADEQIHVEELEKLTSTRTAKVTNEKITLRQVS